MLQRADPVTRRSATRGADGMIWEGMLVPGGLQFRSGSMAPWDEITLTRANTIAMLRRGSHEKFEPT
jgi:hypothetical protein